MNRREFTKSLAAVAAAPALPAKALSMAASPVIPTALYAKAAHWASMWHISTIATYRNILGVDQDLAEAVFSQLQSDGLLTKPDRSGFAYAARPWYREAAVAGRLKQALAPKGDEAGNTSIRQLVEDLVEDEHRGQEPTEAAVTPDQAETNPEDRIT